MIKIRKFNQIDFEHIITLLKQSNLPTNDLKISNMQNFHIATLHNDIIGVGGIDIEDHIAMVRSFAVKKEFRNQGVAKLIYKAIEDKARNANVLRLYLLTETATQYFEKFGFDIIQRDIAPLWIQNSQQFSNLCPKSATFMQKSLNIVNAKEEFDNGYFVQRVF